MALIFTLGQFFGANVHPVVYLMRFCEGPEDAGTPLLSSNLVTLQNCAIFPLLWVLVQATLFFTSTITFLLNFKLHKSLPYIYIIHKNLDIMPPDTTLFRIQHCFFLDPTLFFKNICGLGRPKFTYFRPYCNWKYWIYINIAAFQPKYSV